MLLPNLAFLEELQIFPFLMVILRNTSMSLYNSNGSLIGMKQSADQSGMVPTEK